MQTAKTVKIKNALRYSTKISGEFQLVGDFKLGGSSKRDGTIRILYNGKATRVQVNETDYEVFGSSVDSVEDSRPELSDTELSAEINTRFEVMDTLISGVIKKQIRAMIITGAPGIGKTFSTDQRLHAAHQAGLVRKLSQLTGSATAIGLYLTLYDHREKGDVLVLDDLDAIFQDQEALNLLKGALDTGRTRHIAWMSASKYLRENNIPNEFDFDGTVLFISNLNFDKIISSQKKLAPHCAALINRCVYLDLGVHTNREIMLRIKHVVKTTKIMEQLGIDSDNADEILDWLYENADNLRDLSIRTIIELASYVRTSPNTWKTIASVTMIRR